MPAPERVLVDTSAFYALVSASDNFHDKARETYEAVIDRELELWTTSYILVEMTALVHRRLGFDPLRTLMEVIEGNVEVFWVERTVHSQAWKQFVVHHAADMSFVDWTTTLAAMRLKAHVFTFDRHLTQQGIPTIPG